MDSITFRSADLSCSGEQWQLSLGFLITQVMSSSVALKYNEWMTVFTFCDTDLKEAIASAQQLSEGLQEFSF